MTEDTFSLPTLPSIDERLIADAPPNLRPGMRTLAAWEDESGVVPSDIQVNLESDESLLREVLSLDACRLK